ncbi:MAG TPA: YegS/Rv2252/BmrU family lipid kinase, partial [Chitinispirillaceae bacterium]|nr:YegS/Rv2252/BmrU family lipid kinase [Chitinispirillaceae bacterium]
MKLPDKKYVAVILAHEKSGELSSIENRPFLSHIPVAGRPMLEWVVNAAYRSKVISSIVVIGPEQINDLYCRRYINIQVNNPGTDGDKIVELLPSPDTTIHSRDYSPQNRFILLSTSTILVTPATIDTLVTEFDSGMQQIAIVATHATKLINNGFIPAFAFKKSDVLSAPAGIVIVKDSLAFRKAVAKLNTVILHKNKTIIDVNKNNRAPVSWFDPDSEEQCKILFSDHYTTAAQVTTLQEFTLAQKVLYSQKPDAKRKKVTLIINPYSGSGSTISKYIKNVLGLKQRSFDQGESPEVLSERIRKYLLEYNFTTEIHLTKSSEDATGIARSCIQMRRDMVIVAGGDGTINAVINGLAGSDIALGIIPLGTVNLLATELGIPADIRSACQSLTEGKPRFIDLGRINNRYFASLAGVGFDAFVLKETRPALKHLIGGLAYVFYAVTSVMKYPFKSIHIHIDEEPVQRKGYLLLIGNGKYFGANMPVAPLASMNDHKLDCVLYRKKGIIGTAQYFWKIKTGNISQSPYTEYLKVKRVDIAAHGKHPVHGDGELFGTTPVTV